MQNKNQRKWLPLVLGFLYWILCFFLLQPDGPLELEYVVVLLLAAPLWLIPMVWQILGMSKLFQKLIIPVVLIFSTSFLFERKMVAAFLTLPWLCLTLYAAYHQFFTWKRNKERTLTDHCQLAAFVYLPVGVAWAFADRMSMQPMGFSQTITLLTAVHFHYAGFVLPMLATLLLREKTELKPWERLAVWGVILGIPLTAVGITTTQFQLSPIIEIICVTVMACSAFLIGFSYLQEGWVFRDKIIGVLWGLCGLALIAGMTLALCYGWRTVVVIPQLTIPWMYAVHGSLNAIGFALPGVLAWYLSNNWSPNLTNNKNEFIPEA